MKYGLFALLVVGLLGQLGCGSGESGQQGPAAEAPKVSVAVEEAGDNCEFGGVSIAVGDEDPKYVCDPSPGADGGGGVNGTAGADGATGEDGEVGGPGQAGADGAVGAPGNEGAAGAPGADGAVGAPGNEGTVGAPGADGAAGNAGNDGTDGVKPVTTVTPLVMGEGTHLCHSAGGYRVVVTTGADVQSFDVCHGPPASGETCGDAIEVTAGGTWTGQTTIGTTDNYDPKKGSGCPFISGSSGDRVYVVTPSVNTKYKFTVTPEGNFNPIIFSRTDCAATACVAGTRLEGAGMPEVVTFNALAGQSIFTIVDGDFTAGSVRGNFKLTVDIVP